MLPTSSSLLLFFHDNDIHYGIPYHRLKIKIIIGPEKPFLRGMGENGEYNRRKKKSGDLPCPFPAHSKSKILNAQSSKFHYKLLTRHSHHHPNFQQSFGRKSISTIIKQTTVQKEALQQIVHASQQISNLPSSIDIDTKS